MAILHRSLFTCFSLLAFLILLALKLDKKVKWNWFLVFIPMWVFDAVIVIYITFKMIAQCKNRYNPGQVSMPRKVFYMIFVLLKMSFQVLLCMKLEYYNKEINMYFVMIPFWMLFIFAKPHGTVYTPPCCVHGDYENLIKWKHFEDND